MECAVCLAETNRHLEPCRHAMCADCAMQWLPRQPTCPLCRKTVVEFGTPVGSKTIRLGRPSEHAGITFKNVDGGVQVVRTRWRDMACKCGVRTGDVFTHLNGVPVKHHSHAVQIVDCATVLCRDVVCTARAPPRRRLFRWRCGNERW